MVGNNKYEKDRRAAERADRRKSTRNGRRASERRRSWGHMVWLFAGYALYVSIRAVPLGLRRVIGRART